MADVDQIEIVGTEFEASNAHELKMISLTFSYAGDEYVLDICDQDPTIAFGLVHIGGQEKAIPLAGEFRMKEPHCWVNEACELEFHV
jgi:hypothetical protein